MNTNKGDPIPTRFDPPENEAINAIARRTGLPNAEIVRRAVRLLAQQVKARGSVGFIVEELSPAPPLRENPVMIPKKTPTKQGAAYLSPSARSSARPQDRSTRDKGAQDGQQNNPKSRKRDDRERD
jgi:hypothetical protein